MNKHYANLDTNPCKMCMPMGGSIAMKGIENSMILMHGSQGCSTYIRRHMTECEVNIDTHKFVQISEMVERYSKKYLSTHKPVVGKDVFSHESGIHVDGLLKDIRTYQHLDPALLGRDNQFVLGKHSGKAAKEYFSKN